MTISLPERPIIVDSNESRKPLLFGLPDTLTCPYTVALPAGDYSLLGLEYFTAVELKRIEDLAACCAGRREHFYGQLKKLTKLEHPHVVMGCTIPDILTHGYRSQIPPRTILATLASYANTFKGVQFHFVSQQEDVIAAWTRELLCKAEITFERKYGKLRKEQEGRADAQEADQETTGARESKITR